MRRLYCRVGRSWERRSPMALSAFSHLLCPALLMLERRMRVHRVPWSSAFEPD